MPYYSTATAVLRKHLPAVSDLESAMSSVYHDRQLLGKLCELLVIQKLDRCDYMNKITNSEIEFVQYCPFEDDSVAVLSAVAAVNCYLFVPCSSQYKGVDLGTLLGREHSLATGTLMLRRDFSLGMGLGT